MGFFNGNPQGELVGFCINGMTSMALFICDISYDIIHQSSPFLYVVFDPFPVMDNLFMSMDWLKGKS